MDKDTNCNDLITIEIKVNGKPYFKAEKNCNQVFDWWEVRGKFTSFLHTTTLMQLNRFK